MSKRLASGLLAFFIASNTLPVAVHIATEDDENDEPKEIEEHTTREEPKLNAKPKTPVNAPTTKRAGNEQEKEERASKETREASPQKEKGAELEHLSKAEPKEEPTPEPKPVVEEVRQEEPVVVPKEVPKEEPKTHAPTVFYQIVEAEAQGESYRGKVAVAEVVLNRVEHPEFPNSIESVIMQDGQFSPVRDGRLWSVSPTSETREAVHEAMNNGDTLGGAIWFMNPEAATTNWIAETQTEVARIGNHVFYK
jgi:N-acetylmuramoyl-L-alanine amidase